MSSKPKSVAQKLRYYREACALSQQQIADALGVDRTTYTKYETGDSNPKLNTLVSISSIFNVPVEALLPELTEAKKSSRKIRDNPPVDSPIYQLSRDERGLVAMYRVLSREEKRAVKEMIGKLSKKD